MKYRLLRLSLLSMLVMLFGGFSLAAILNASDEGPNYDKFQDFEAIVNNQEGTLLTSEEQVQGTAVEFGIAVNDEGKTLRVATNDPDAFATISGNYHSEHGLTNMKVTVNVNSFVEILVGQCTYSSTPIKVTNSYGVEVASATPATACWKNDHNNITKLIYSGADTGAETTLTITGMQYCPYIAVKVHHPVAERSEFRNFAAIVNNQEGTMLTAEEQVQGKAVILNIAVDDDGNTIRETDPNGSYHHVATITGNYHSEHGLTNMVCAISQPPVTGKLRILVGQCTYSSTPIKVTDLLEQELASVTPATACWKNDHNNVTEIICNSSEFPITITGMQYCPFIAVEKYEEPVAFQDFEITNEQLSGAFDASTLPACATFSGTQRNDNHGYGNVTITVAVDGPTKFTIGGCQYANPANCKVTNAAGEVLATPNLKTATCYHQDGAAATYTYDGEPTTLTFSDIAYLPYFKAEAIEDTPEPHDPVLLVWDYTNKDIPTTGPDNGLYYGAYVNDPAGTNNGMHGVKLNSSGWAYFEKPAVAGKLTLTFGNRKTADAYAVNVSTGTLGADNVGVKGDLIGEVAVAESPGTGSIDIPAEVTGIYINRKTGSEGVLQKIVFKEDVPRQFVDFEITNEQLSGAFDASTLPAGVTFNGTQRNDSHGYGNVTITVPVDGTVKFTIGGCQYANPANCKVTNAAGEVLATPNLRTATCYHQDGAAATYIYVGEPTTLTFSEIAYLPYFKAEATDVHEVTVTYKDQNGGVLGKKTVYEGDPIGEIPYTEADLTIPAGEKFRGWVYNSKIKVKATDIVNADVTVNASVTPIEEAPTVGSIQTYDLTQATFYPEDHENFSVEGGTYYNNHGFTFADGGSFTVAVTSKAQIVLNLCQYGNGTTITVVDSQGRVVTDNLPAKAEADGGTAVLNYEGPAGQLQFTFATQAYLHKVTVYNVSDFLAKDESGYYIVPANDGASLIMAINAVAADPNAKIFLPNGTYDLGEATLTGISGTNVSIIGQSMENVVIKNAPAIEMEGLGKADLFNNTSTGLYLQDLTLQNALDYYKAGTGRAATLHDQGTKTINKNVRHLSYQDTYYSHKVGGLYYFEGGEMHGTVDYLCGNGKAFFEGMKIINEKRNSATITANSELYVFNNCVVENNADKYTLGRAWSDHPVCIYLNTTLLDPDKLEATRWNLSGINCDYSIAGEYATKNAAGENITPASNEITFKKENTTLNTILSAEQAATYTMESVLGDWAATAKQEAKQLEAPAAEFANGTVTWTPANDGAIAYMIEKNGEFVGITAGSSMAVEANAESDKLTIRAANARGGFGEAKQVAYTGTSIQAINAAIERGEQVIFNLAGQRVNKATKGMYIINGKKMVVK